MILQDTVIYEGKEHRYVDYASSDVLQMCFLATKKVHIYCHASKKDRLRSLLTEPLPIESHLDHVIHDLICAEVVAKTIENKQVS